MPQFSTGIPMKKKKKKKKERKKKGKEDTIICFMPS